MCATYTIDKKTLPLSDLSEKNNLLHFNSCYLICETIVLFFANAPVRYTWLSSDSAALLAFCLQLRKNVSALYSSGSTTSFLSGSPMSGDDGASSVVWTDCEAGVDGIGDDGSAWSGDDGRAVMDRSPNSTMMAERWWWQSCGWRGPSPWDLRALIIFMPIARAIIIPFICKLVWNLISGLIRAKTSANIRYVEIRTPRAQTHAKSNAGSEHDSRNHFLYFLYFVAQLVRAWVR